MQEHSSGLYDPNRHHDACGVGFVVNIRGERSHGIVSDAIRALCHLEHRGATGGDNKTGDGAGILFQIPHDFFTRVLDFELPPPGRYGAGFLFLPRRERSTAAAVRLVEETVSREGGAVLGWRTVPVAPGCLGEQARREMPAFRQLFVTFPERDEALERRLYRLRRSLEKAAARKGWGPDRFYIPSLSSRTMVYKGMFVSTQFESFYPDLREPDLTSAMAMFHQRYSTNTFPSWYLAQPFRIIAHNGEINTLRRNVNNMRARETSLNSELLGGPEGLAALRPLVNPSLSDSAIFDNVLELLVRGGRSLSHALVMMIPEAFGSRYHISEDKRAFFEYHAAVMEPWDGPAAVGFCDGTRVGAILDRNGLRPARYTITKSGRMVLASEAGVLAVPAEDVLEKGRLAPGKIIMVDTGRGRVIKDHEIKSAVSRRRPYRHWLERNRLQLRGLLGAPRHPAGREGGAGVARAQRAFGYTREDLRRIIVPMVENAQEPVGSMGNDTPPAVLSRRPQLLFSYFKQLFAQVTNPPIDPYRENLVMSLMSFVGREHNLLSETPEHCRQLKLSHPVLTNDDMELLRGSSLRDFAVRSVDILFDAESGALKPALEAVCREAEACIDDGASLIILSDRGMCRERAAIPSLLAMSGVHHHLVRRGKRHLSGLVIETGEAREVHHFAALIGFGASGINPYLVFESLEVLQELGYLSAELSVQEASERYITAVKKGLLKVLSKMGISTIRSYRGAQIFEAVGLSREFLDRYFTGTPSLIGGDGLARVEADKLALHHAAFAPAPAPAPAPVGPEAAAVYGLASGGLYAQRRGGEAHRFSPLAVALLQRATREGDYRIFKQYSAEADGGGRGACTLRSLFRFSAGSAVPLEEVEPEEAIIPRFVTSAMSLGSISREAHETLALAMNRLGSRSNSGEGGEEAARYRGRSGQDSINSRIKQVASARFGVTSGYLTSAEELQIKMAQGAKPGEGGQLPGGKVSGGIARVRHSTPGVMLISPPPHHDIYSIEDLAQLIFDLKHANPRARVSVKLVSQVGVGTVAAGVAKGRADTVLISGGDGGTGASPLSSLLHTGTPWEIGLSETQQVLVGSGLRAKIRVQVDGQLKTGRDVVIAALLGAEEFGFATTALVTLGCVMMRKCHTNGCPVGVATQDPALRRRFTGRPEHVESFMRFLAREVREIMAELGFRRFEDMIGRVDRLRVDQARAAVCGLDFSRLLTPPAVKTGSALRCLGAPEPYSASLDSELIAAARPALEEGRPVRAVLEIRNADRAVGAGLSAEISSRFGEAGLPAGTVTIGFTGSAGQSFGAFLAPGISFELEGEANDCLGKGLSGGRIILRPPRASGFLAERNIITGNVCLYGATGGEAYVCGRAGERFAVRNSGALAVVEGVGDHACEYMTGGRVVIIGDTGLNFAAGMSGGIAYVLDANQLFDTRCNLEMVDVEPVLDPEDREFLQRTLAVHAELTGSRNAAQILARWEEMLPLFVKVFPIEYREALKRRREKESRDAEREVVTEEVYA